jgi:molecular chaperone DnaK
MTAFGIDLGTTNSCIAYLDASGRPVTVRNAVGETTTPSVVYFKDRDKVIVGSAAKNAALLAPHYVAQLIKREMGRSDVAYTYHKERYTPEMISAFVIRELADSAARQTGEPVHDVVITVPAYFGMAEREATRKAGEIAGLNVLNVLDEPVAAALSRQDRHAAGGARHLLVYDLGGGTFDTTVIRVEGSDVRVVGTDGEQRLGGADWDEKIRTYLLNAFAAEHPGLDPSADEQFMQDLALMAEAMKKELSSALTRSRNLRFRGKVAKVELSRQRLEELTSDLLDRTMDITERTLREARRHRVYDLDEVLLVGGMTRMPVIATRLKERFGLEVQRHEPDLAVAQGAALFALISQAQQAQQARGARSQPAGGAATADIAGRLGVSEDRAEAMMSTRVTTVVPRGFGIKVVDENDPVFAASPHKARLYIMHLLPANTPLPADSGAVPFATSIANQPVIDLEVWEQKGPVESEELADNTLVGRGRLRLPARLPMRTAVQVTFSMNETGLLTVHAEEPESGREVRFDLQIGGMDQAAVDTARNRVARHDVSS